MTARSDLGNLLTVVLNTPGWFWLKLVVMLPRVPIKIWGGRVLEGTCYADFQALKGVWIRMYWGSHGPPPHKASWERLVDSPRCCGVHHSLFPRKQMSCSRKEPTRGR